MMSSSKPQLGSLAVQAPTLTPQIIHVSVQTCWDLSLFKALVREYRTLDDTINMRLNRATAFVRNEERERSNPGKTTLQDQACARIWQELVANWGRRKLLVEYCVAAVDESMNEKQRIVDDQASSPSAIRKARAEKYSDEVKRNQMHNELSVETIVKKRTLEAFKSRCRYFVPPLTDEEARKMWNAASSGR